MKVINKWNKKQYEVLEITDKEVKLKRLSDTYNGKAVTTFAIAKSEYYFTYSEK